MPLKMLKPHVRMAPAQRVLNTSPAGAWRAGKQGANARGYTYRWQRAAKAFLAEHPLCQGPDCMEGLKRITVATVVDHKVPHRGDSTLFWDQDNWQAMCKACHDRKTGGEGKSFQPLGSRPRA